MRFHTASARSRLAAMQRSKVEPFPKSRLQEKRDYPAISSACPPKPPFGVRKLSLAQSWLIDCFEPRAAGLKSRLSLMRQKKTKAIRCIAARKADLRGRCSEFFGAYDRVADKAAIVGMRSGICLVKNTLHVYRKNQPQLRGDSVMQKQALNADHESISAELAYALQREAATREILELIRENREDEGPVLDAILRSASHLCKAPMAVLGLITSDGNHYTVAKHRGMRPEVVEYLRNNPPELDPEKYVAALAMVEMRPVHVEDLANPNLYGADEQARLESVKKEGMRTVLCVPLISQGRAIGAFFLYRRVVLPFRDDEIALVSSFAEQAVIAIENVRLFREVQSRLERERASTEVLGVISQSRDDETPVFDVILRNAARLCHAPIAALSLITPDGEHYTIAAHHGMKPDFVEYLRANPPQLDPEKYVAARAMVERQTIHVDDLADPSLYGASDSVRLESVRKEGVRTAFYVPLILLGKPIGGLFLYRREVSPFREDEVALVNSFAAQAVIAIENVRQFKALETLNAELGDRVREQVDEIERMGKLKRFLPSAVADTVISSGSDKMLSSHRALLGVLFCDIRGFTAFCETAEPEETIEVLQTYHEEMGKLINAHGAGVDHRMGDGIMVLFNDPLPCEDPAGNAVRLAIAMRERMAELGKEWKRLGFRLGFGVGVSLGYATIGMVGFEGRFDYTASGTAINLGARLCDEAEDGEILMSPRAAIAVEDAFTIESRGKLNLKGIREPIEVFSVA